MSTDLTQPQIDAATATLKTASTGATAILIYVGEEGDKEINSLFDQVANKKRRKRDPIDELIATHVWLRRKAKRKAAKSRLPSGYLLLRP